MLLILTGVLNQMKNEKSKWGLSIPESDLEARKYFKKGMISGIFFGIAIGLAIHIVIGNLLTH